MWAETFLNLNLYVINNSLYWALSMSFFFFSFFFKYWVQLPSSYWLLENILMCWIFLPIPHSRAFFEGRCHLEPCNPCYYVATITSGFKAAVVGNSHRAAALLRSQFLLLGQQSLPGGSVPRLKIRIECPGTSPQNFMSPYLCLFFKFNFYFLSE